MANLDILLVTSEMVPFAKTGGLADVCGALSRQLATMDHDVRVILPYYRHTQDSGETITPVEGCQNIAINLGVERVHYSVHEARLAPHGPTVYLLDCPDFFQRTALYTNDPDEHLRFALLSRAALELCLHLDWIPQIIHCNDWQSGLLPLYLKLFYANTPLGSSRTVFGLHNLGYQGVFSAWHLGALGLQQHTNALPQDDLHSGRLNLLKIGILHADALVTVSPTYAQEIQTPTLGMGLEGLLQQRSASLQGILNGVDYQEWDPTHDRHIPFPFSAADLDGKARNKTALLQQLNLGETQTAPVLGMVSRLVEQKGLDLLMAVLPELIWHRDLRLVVLGSGEGTFEQFFADLHRDHPHKVCFYRGFNNYLAHIIEAGSDFFLMPSRYEPCGLNQMYSLRYGTIPVVHRTGGLADTVQPFDTATGRGTGVVFEHYDIEGLRWALQSAFDLYRDKTAWQQLQQNAMAADFGWPHQAQEYVDCYRRLLA